VNLTFDHPQLLWLALAIAPLAVVGWIAMRQFDRLRRTIAIGLRALLLLALIIVLAAPHAQRRHDQLTVIALVDVSESIQRFAAMPPAADGSRLTYQQHLTRWLNTAAASRRPDDRFGVVVFDGAAQAVRVPSSSDDPIDLGDAPEQSGTAIADAVRLGLAMFPADSARRLVLVSDGNETVGNMLDAAREAIGGSLAATGDNDDAAFFGAAPIDVMPIEYAVTSDAQVVRLESPPNARPGQAVTVRIVMEATRPIAGRLILRHEGSVIDINGPEPGRTRAVTLPQGRSTHLATVQLAETPVNRFEALFEPDDPSSDILPENNRGEVFTATPGRGRILIVESEAGGSGSVLNAMLADAGLDTELLSASQTPSDLLSLQNYDLIVLNNVGAYELSAPQQTMLTRYVSDLGGGLIMIGGDNGFGAGGWTGTELADILPIETDPPKEYRLPRAALVLVLDHSGSMAEPAPGARAVQADRSPTNPPSSPSNRSGAETLIGVIAFSDFGQHPRPAQAQRGSRRPRRAGYPLHRPQRRNQHGARPPQSP
jgi:Ca-activated chloride channel family protein